MQPISAQISLYPLRQESLAGPIERLAGSGIVAAGMLVGAGAILAPRTVMSGASSASAMRRLFARAARVWWPIPTSF